jgi:hypothetical protein
MCWERWSRSGTSPPEIYSRTMEAGAPAHLLEQRTHRGGSGFQAAFPSPEARHVCLVMETTHDPKEVPHDHQPERYPGHGCL